MRLQRGSSVAPAPFHRQLARPSRSPGQSRGGISSLRFRFLCAGWQLAARCAAKHRAPSLLVSTRPGAMSLLFWALTRCWTGPGPRGGPRQRPNYPNPLQEHGGHGWLARGTLLGPRCAHGRGPRPAGQPRHADRWRCDLVQVSPSTAKPPPAPPPSARLPHSRPAHTPRGKGNSGTERGKEKEAEKRAKDGEGEGRAEGGVVAVVA